MAEACVGIASRRARLADASAPGHQRAVEDISNYLSLMHLLSRSIDQVLAENCGLTALQYRILLRLLGSADRPMCAAELASNLSVGLSTVSASVSKLVEGGLVRRVEAPHDMRILNLVLTKAGLFAIERADEHVGRFLESYWRCLTREQLEAAIASCLSAACIHGVSRIENGHHRLDTAFFDAIMISRTLTAHRLSACGFKTAEFRVLVDLYALGAGATCSQVARRLFLNSSDVTAPIGRLEADGLLAKNRSAENRRAKQVTLTHAGARKTVELLPVVFDALLETCHSNEEAIKVHLEAANHAVRSERASVFA